MGIVKKIPYKRWATDNIWAYSIDFDKLKQELASFAPTENQIAVSLKLGSRAPKISQHTEVLLLHLLNNIQKCDSLIAESR